MPVSQIHPLGTKRSVVLNDDGSARQFIGNMPSRLLETPPTNQYFLPYNRRYNYDGSPDFSYVFDHTPFAVAEHSGIGAFRVFEDRSVLISGRFRLKNDTMVHPLVKVDEWGGWDTTFALRPIWGNPNRAGYELFPLQGGGYLLNGSAWTHYDGHPVGALVRIGDDGSLDTTFRFPSSSSWIGTVVEQADGKYVLGGWIWLDDYPDTLHVVRVHGDGSLDTTFHNFGDYRWGDLPHNALLATIQCVAPLDASRLFVGGTFTQIDGQARNGIACIDTSGQLLDCWAEGGLVAPPPVDAITPRAHASLKCLPNGDCYIYGFYRGLIDSEGFHPEQAYISRLKMPGTTGVADRPAVAAGVQAWPNPGTGSVQLSWPGVAVATLEVRDAPGRRVSGPEELRAPFQADLGSLPPGLYHLVLTAPGGGRAVVKWVKE